MKKSFIVLLLALCPFVATKAQFNFGVKAGVNVANINELSGENVLEANSYTGFYVGPKFDWYMFGRLGISGAILYSQTGMVWDNSQEAVDLNAVSIPLNLTAKLFGSDKFGLFLEVGPQFNFNIGEKRHQLEEGSLTLENSTLSWNLGASLHLLKFLQVGVNYNVPFGPTSEFSFSDMENQDAYKMHTIQASVAIVF